MEQENIVNSTIEIKHEWTPCFFSASWIIKIFINGKIYKESDGKDNEWLQEDIESWVRSTLLKNWSDLTNQGVNVNEEYQKWCKNLF